MGGTAATGTAVATGTGGGTTGTTGSPLTMLPAIGVAQGTSSCNSGLLLVIAIAVVGIRAGFALMRRAARP